MKITLKPDMVSVRDKLPPLDFRVIVVGNGYRCLGYIDRERIWRDDAHDNELHDVIGWIEL